MKPVTPSTTASGRPPFSETIVGLPEAIALTLAMQRPSMNVVGQWTKMSNAASTDGMSFCQPPKMTWFETPSSRAKFCKSLRTLKVTLVHRVMRPGNVEDHVRVFTTSYLGRSPDQLLLALTLNEAGRRADDLLATR